MMAAEIHIDGLRKHIGTKIVEEDEATRAPLFGLVAAFDRDDAVPTKGEAIPPGWHLAYFNSFARRATLGEDGLPTSGGVIPDVPFPRRMYAGTSLTFHHPLLVGDALKRETELTDMTLRSGSTAHSSLPHKRDAYSRHAASRSWRRVSPCFATP